LAAALRQSGIAVGLQAPAEKLFKDWQQRDYRRIISYCRTARAFQDIPFNLPGMYPILDASFPNSKFILTVRESSEIWYESYIRFQKKVHGNGVLPTVEMLKNREYCYRGYAYETKKFVCLTTDDDIFNKARLIEHYERYNNNVCEYFRRKPENFLLLNVADKNAYESFCRFVGVPARGNKFPWENRTRSESDDNA
jgi:hypothetical protein